MSTRSRGGRSNFRFPELNPDIHLSSLYEEGSQMDSTPSMAVAIKKSSFSRKKEIQQMEKTLTFWQQKVSDLETRLTEPKSKQTIRRLKKQLKEAQKEVSDREHQLNALTL